LPQVQSSGESSPGVQDTMATNILKILQERREKISKISFHFRIKLQIVLSS